MNNDLRTKKAHERYMKERAKMSHEDTCRLCKIKSTKKFKYWKIIPNEYPWDMIATKHDMMISNRHTNYEKLNKKEMEEYRKIKINYIEKKYEMIAEAVDRKKSIPGHFHLHLLNIKNFH